MPEERSWLAATHQLWKLRLLYGLIAIGIVEFVAFYLLLASTVVSDELKVTALLLATATGVATLAWSFWGMRCDVCRGRPGWVLVKRESASSWLRMILRANACPLCGHVPNRSSDRARDVSKRGHGSE